VVGAPPVRGARNLQVESLYEYGSRVGFWRLMRVFAERSIKISVFAIGMALERHREAAAAIVEAGHEVVSHGWRWIDYQSVDSAVEREHMRLAIDSLTRATGSRPLGWYTGRLSPNTRRLVVEEGGFLYDSDAYNDDLPYWVRVADRPHLVIPYTLDNNDMKFGTPQGFSTGDDFFAYLRDAFDVLYGEGADRALWRRRRPAPDDVGGASHASGGATGTATGSHEIPRPRRAARPRVDVPAHRHRSALDRESSAPGVVIDEACR